MKKKPAKLSKEKKTAPAAADDAWQWITKEQAAKLMQCTLATIGNMVNDGRLIANKAGRVDLETVVDVVRGKADRAKQKGEDADARKRDARLQEMNIAFREAKTRDALIKIEAQTGKYISRTDAVRDMVAATTLVRTSLKEWAATLSPKVAGLDIREAAAVLDTETDKILNAMADTMERTARKAEAVEQGRAAG